MSKRALTLHTAMSGHQAGAVILIDVDEHGTPLDRFWRSRLKDAKIDNCCTLATSEKRARKGTKK